MRPKNDILIVLRPTIWRCPKIEVPLNHPFDFRIFHYKPSILGYPYLVLYVICFGPIKSHCILFVCFNSTTLRKKNVMFQNWIGGS